MLQELQDLLLFLSTWIILPPSLLALLYFRKFEKPFRIISFYVWLACLAEISSSILMARKIPNLPLLHIYTVGEFVLLYLFFEKLFGKFYSVRFLRAVATGFVVFSIVNSLFIQRVSEFNSYARTTEAILMIVLSLLCFWQQANSPGFPPGAGWINTGILLYFSGALFLFILSNYIIPMGKQLNYQIWAVHSLLSIIYYILISIGLWKARIK